MDEAATAKQKKFPRRTKIINWSVQCRSGMRDHDQQQQQQEKNRKKIEK